MELPLCCCGPEMVLCDVLLSSGAPGLDGCVENGFRVTLLARVGAGCLCPAPAGPERRGETWFHVGCEAPELGAASSSLRSA